MGNQLSLCPSVVQDLAHCIGVSSSDGGRHPTNVEFSNGVLYRVDRLIAEGGFAYVYRATNMNSNEIVALKRFNMEDEEQQQQCSDEVKIHQGLCPHPNIVNIYGHSKLHRSNTTLPELWIAMEYCNGPSAQDYVNYALAHSDSVLIPSASASPLVPTRRILPPAVVFSIVNACVAALAHMHSQSPPVAHWDVKLDNLLSCGGRTTAISPTVCDNAQLRDSSLWKLCDFGSATETYYQIRNTHDVNVAEVELTAKMTLLYRPPEALDLWLKQRVDTKADVWSLGVAIYVLVFLEMPFDENSLDIITAVPKRYRPFPNGPHTRQAAPLSSNKPQFNDPPPPGENGLPVVEQDSAQNEPAAEDNLRFNPCPSEFAALMQMVLADMLVKDPNERKDIFTIAEKLSPITGLPPISRPRPGFQSLQKPRFQ